MAKFSQANRPMKVSTPLGKDVLLLTRLQGSEALSHLFHFTLDLLATNYTEVPFDKLLGQKATVELQLLEGKKRFFSGIISKIGQGRRDDIFTEYRAELVPAFWLLTRRVQCRIFQHLNVPDILKKVLDGLEISLELVGTTGLLGERPWPTREYCVQYNQSDFDFASMLMEEEGISYYFKHTESGHTLVLTNSNRRYPDVPEYKSAVFGEVGPGIFGKGKSSIFMKARSAIFGKPKGPPDVMRVTDWQKTQELRSGKVTLWDHCFEMPDKHLEAERTTVETVAVGQQTHKLKVANNEQLEIFEYPGDYAHLVDGIDRGGGPQAKRLEEIFDQNKRYAEMRMQEETAAGVVIKGTSNCRQFTAGHKFTLEKHYNADGAYLLTSVEHSASLTGNYRSGEAGGWEYQNHFNCIPMAVQYRPPRKTPKPLIEGMQTAVVVGPPGDKIFVDKYGRVKVQFFWDRHGKNDADSSCWVRVSNNWGGAGWGGQFLPHVGHEVIVSFENGDPELPIITGRVYNAAKMPPLELPDHKTKSTIRDHGDNHVQMEGKDGKQQIHMFSPVGTSSFSIGADPKVDGFRFETERGWWAGVKGNYETIVGGDASNSVAGSQVEVVGYEWYKTPPFFPSNATYTYGNRQQVSVPVQMDTAFGYSIFTLLDPANMMVNAIFTNPIVRRILGLAGGRIELIFGNDSRTQIGLGMVDCTGQLVTSVKQKPSTLPIILITLNFTLLGLTVFLPLAKQKASQEAAKAINQALTIINMIIFAMSVLAKLYGVKKDFTHYTTRWAKIVNDMCILPLPLAGFSRGDLQPPLADHMKSLLQMESGIHHNEVEKRYCLDCAEILAVSDGPVRIWVRNRDAELSLIGTKIRSASESYSVSSSEKTTLEVLDILGKGSKIELSQKAIQLTCVNSKIELTDKNITISSGSSKLVIGPAEIKTLTQVLKQSAASVAVRS